jgi:hypothetical protein
LDLLMIGIMVRGCEMSRRRGARGINTLPSI